MVRSSSLQHLLALACLAAATYVAAQPGAASAPRSGTPDALNAQAAVPPLRHESAFTGYRRHTEATPIDWKDANDTVTRIGGWRAYAREATLPAAAPPKAKP